MRTSHPAKEFLRGTHRGHGRAWRRVGASRKIVHPLILPQVKQPPQKKVVKCQNLKGVSLKAVKKGLVAGPRPVEVKTSDRTRCLVRASVSDAAKKKFESEVLTPFKYHLIAVGLNLEIWP